MSTTKLLLRILLGGGRRPAPRPAPAAPSRRQIQARHEQALQQAHHQRARRASENTGHSTDSDR